MFLYLVCHMAAFLCIHISHMLLEVGNGGVDGFDRLFHTVAHVEDDGIFHAVGLASLFVGQFQVFITLTQHISEVSDVCDMLADALLHLTEFILSNLPLAIRRAASAS